MQLRRSWLLTFSVLLLLPFLGVESFSEHAGNYIATEKEAYAAGETVTVIGHLAIDENSPVILQIVSPIGNLVDVYQVTPDSEDNFSVDIATSIGGLWKESGTYIIKATHYYDSFETQFDYGGVMSAAVKSSETSETLSESEMGQTVDPLSVGTNVITIEDYDILYQITGAKILKIIPDVENKSLIIEIETFSDGELMLTIPKQILDTNEGDFFVLVDGEETNHDSSSTDDAWTLIIPFYNGSEEIEIIGTFVIPEFGTIAAIILAVAITSIIVLSAKTKLSIMPKL